MPTAGFPPELHDSLRTLKETTRRIIESTCGSQTRAKDISTILGLHAKLGWQIWHVAFSSEFEIHQFLPNAAGIKQFSQSALKKGAFLYQIEQFNQSLSTFYNLVELHATSKEMFELILDAQGEQSASEKEIKYRRQAFLGNAFTFGVYAKTVLAAGIFYPGEQANTFGLIRLHGLINLVQSRIGIRWPVSTLTVQQPDGSDDAPSRIPLFPTNSEGPILPDFCSSPLPIVTRRMDGQTVVDELQAGIVGLTGARTLFTGEKVPFVGPTVASEPGEAVHLGSGVRTPAELLIFDHFVHKDLFPVAKRELRIYSELSSPTAHDERDRLNMNEQLDCLGTGTGSVSTADVPNYSNLIEAAFSQIDFHPDEFIHYRVRMPYPPIPASVMVKHLMNDSADINSTPVKKEES
jgi:hypothetical protein